MDPNFTVQVLRQPESNIFAGFERKELSIIKSCIINAIMATDMSVHTETCKKLDLRSPETPFAATAADRQLCVNVLIHSADLSAQTLAYPVARNWESRIAQEFAHQAICERQQGYEPANFMCNLDSLQVRNAQQVGFIDFVLFPWWKNIARLFPGMQLCLDNLIKNRKAYADGAVRND
jgi:hypothetical protein